MEARLTAEQMNNLIQGIRGVQDGLDYLATHLDSELNDVDEYVNTVRKELNDSINNSVAVLTNGINSLEESKLDKTANAVSASKLQTARAISLSGAVSGSGTFDGSANVNIPITSNVVTGLVTATSNTGTANEATNNSNTFLNIVETVNGIASSVGSSSKIVGARGVSVESDTAGTVTITGPASTSAVNSTSTSYLATSAAVKTAYDKGVEALTKANENATQITQINNTLSNNTGGITLANLKDASWVTENNYPIRELSYGAGKTFTLSSGDISLMPYPNNPAHTTTLSTGEYNFRIRRIKPNVGYGTLQFSTGNASQLCLSVSPKGRDSGDLYLTLEGTGSYRCSLSVPNYNSYSNPRMEQVLLNFPNSTIYHNDTFAMHYDLMQCTELHGIRSYIMGDVEDSSVKQLPIISADVVLNKTYSGEKVRNYGKDSAINFGTWRVMSFIDMSNIGFKALLVRIA